MTEIMFDYFRVLERYDFEPADDGAVFRSPGGRVSVIIADPEGALAVIALTGDRVRLVSWTIQVNNAPAEVLDAALRAAEPELATRVDGEQRPEVASVRPGRKWTNEEIRAALTRIADRQYPVLRPRPPTRPGGQISAHGI